VPSCYNIQKHHGYVQSPHDSTECRVNIIVIIACVHRFSMVAQAEQVDIRICYVCTGYVHYCRWDIKHD
jgi:hypothetical protein